MSNWIKNWFSNMELLDNPIYDNFGISYSSVENYYQAMKAVNENDRDKFIGLTPREAKRLGRTIQLRKDWDKIKVGVLLSGLMQKFLPGTKWHNKLMSISVFEDIVEVNNWHDNFWGDCICDRCKNIKGKNELGLILMVIRDLYT